jgi:glycine cleavage system regulatory protein
VQAAAAQEVADRIAGVNVAVAAAAAASAGIQTQITNLLDGSAANLQTLAQVASYANSLDGENDALLAALTSDVQAMRLELDVLLGL